MNCFYNVSVTLSYVYCVTYSILFGTASPTTSNDGSSKKKADKDRVEDHHGNETGLNHFDVAAVVHCVERNLSEYICY